MPWKKVENTKPIAYYGSLPIIVDDGMTKTGTGATLKYYSYLYGFGAIALGFGSPKVPFETKRDPDSGNGGGQETLFSRQELIIHPQGFKCGLAETPTAANLVDAVNWTRAFERKRVPLVCLISKG